MTLKELLETMDKRVSFDLGVRPQYSYEQGYYIENCTLENQDIYENYLDCKVECTNVENNKMIILVQQN